MAYLCKGQPWPFEELQSQGEISNPFDKLPAAKPQKKIPEKVKIRVLRGDIVIGCGVTNPKIGSTHTIPTSAAFYLQRLGGVEIVMNYNSKQKLKLFETI